MIISCEQELEVLLVVGKKFLHADCLAGGASTERPLPSFLLTQACLVTSLYQISPKSSLEPLKDFRFFFSFPPRVFGFPKEALMSKIDSTSTLDPAW